MWDSICPFQIKKPFHGAHVLFSFSKVSEDPQPGHLPHALGVTTQNLQYLDSLDKGCSFSYLLNFSHLSALPGKSTARTEAGHSLPSAQAGYPSALRAWHHLSMQCPPLWGAASSTVRAKPHTQSSGLHHGRYNHGDLSKVIGSCAEPQTLIQQVTCVRGTSIVRSSQQVLRDDWVWSTLCMF